MFGDYLVPSGRFPPFWNLLFYRSVFLIQPSPEIIKVEYNGTFQTAGHLSLLGVRRFRRFIHSCIRSDELCSVVGISSDKLNRPNILAQNFFLFPFFV